MTEMCKGTSPLVCDQKNRESCPYTKECDAVVAKRERWYAFEMKALDEGRLPLEPLVEVGCEHCHCNSCESARKKMAAWRAARNAFYTAWEKEDEERSAR